MPAKLTHEEFITRLNEIYPDKPYKIIGRYDGTHTKILVENKYGQCLSTCNDLLAQASALTLNYL